MWRFFSIFLFLIFSRVFCEVSDEEESSGSVEKRQTLTIQEFPDLKSRQIPYLLLNQSSNRNPGWKDSLQSLLNLIDEENFQAEICGETVSSNSYYHIKNDFPRTSTFFGFLETERRRYLRTSGNPEVQIVKAQNGYWNMFVNFDLENVMSFSVSQKYKIVLGSPSKGIQITEMSIKSIEVSGASCMSNSPVVDTWNDQNQDSDTNMSVEEFIEDVKQKIPFLEYSEQRIFSPRFHDGLIDTYSKFDGTWTSNEFIAYMVRLMRRYKLVSKNVSKILTIQQNHTVFQVVLTLENKKYPDSLSVELWTMQIEGKPMKGEWRIVRIFLRPPQSSGNIIENQWLSEYIEETEKKIIDGNILKTIDSKLENITICKEVQKISKEMRQRNFHETYLQSSENQSGPLYLINCQSEIIDPTNFKVICLFSGIGAVFESRVDFQVLFNYKKENFNVRKMEISCLAEV
ncbi:unnamed protein product [Caenorhabditis angaria]|uniref:DUF38 domain-containing protein n=1 Tax=Caenorhabditis angaria TaxID=860376 RepID=A0A9P1IAA8_9PELO|nr:unnamed protein product [Caenorhabditis angaria]